MGKRTCLTCHVSSSSCGHNNLHSSRASASSVVALIGSSSPEVDVCKVRRLAQDARPVDGVDRAEVVLGDKVARGENGLDGLV